MKHFSAVIKQWYGIDCGTEMKCSSLDSEQEYFQRILLSFLKYFYRPMSLLTDYDKKR